MFFMLVDGHKNFYDSRYAFCAIVNMVDTLSVTGAHQHGNVDSPMKDILDVQ